MGKRSGGIPSQDCLSHYGVTIENQEEGEEENLMTQHGPVHDSGGTKTPSFVDSVVTTIGGAVGSDLNGSLEFPLAMVAEYGDRSDVSNIHKCGLTVIASASRCPRAPPNCASPDDTPLKMSLDRRAGTNRFIP